jgi:hypothetical protein
VALGGLGRSVHRECISNFVLAEFDFVGHKSAVSLDLSLTGEDFFTNFMK